MRVHWRCGGPGLPAAGTARLLLHGARDQGVLSVTRMLWAGGARWPEPGAAREKDATSRGLCCGAEAPPPPPGRLTAAPLLR